MTMSSLTDNAASFMHTVSEHLEAHPLLLDRLQEKNEITALLTEWRKCSTSTAPEQQILFSTFMTHLQNALDEAISHYKKAHPWHAKHTRQKNIEEIKEIIRNSPDHDTLRKKLEKYFLKKQDHKDKEGERVWKGYSRGPLSRSALEDDIYKCLWNYDQLYQLLDDQFGKQLPPYQDIEVNITYTLADFISAAIDTYKEEKSNKIATCRQFSINEINHLLKEIKGETAEDTVKNQIQAIRLHLNCKEYSDPLLSHFRQYILDVLEYYEKLFPKRSNLDSVEVTQLLNVRILPAKDGNTKNVVAFLHGWTDSTESGNTLGRLFQEKNYTMICYDHYGHGFDDHRWDTTFRSIPPILLAIQFRKFCTELSESPEKFIKGASKETISIGLVGHSLGGALLAHQRTFIDEQPKITSVVLSAPSFSEWIINLAVFIWRLLRAALDPEFKRSYFRHSEPVPQESVPVSPLSTPLSSQKKSERRMGSNRFGLFNSLLPFMRHSYKTSERQMTDNTPPKKTWHYEAGERDRYLVDEQLEKLKNKNKHPEQCKFKLFPVQGHGIPWTRYPEKVLNKGIVKRIVNSR
ncbi:MAG: alpha/beta fold hydrolase [Gammaproteobacteria bacterium]|nr:alpha/beta fold hydrolase [Gammaproteobacteria bacterium]